MGSDRKTFRHSPSLEKVTSMSTLLTGSGMDTFEARPLDDKIYWNAALARPVPSPLIAPRAQTCQSSMVASIPHSCRCILPGTWRSGARQPAAWQMAVTGRE